MFRSVGCFKEDFEIFSLSKRYKQKDYIRPVLSKLLSASFSGYLSQMF
jgi:hypothetical protein